MRNWSQFQVDSGPWKLLPQKIDPHIYRIPPLVVKMKVIAAALLLSGASAFTSNQRAARRTQSIVKGGFDGNTPVEYSKAGMESLSDLQGLAQELNPAVKFWLFFF